MAITRHSGNAGPSAVALDAAADEPMSVAARYLLIAFASVVIGSCGSLPPGPTDASGRSARPTPPRATVAASLPAGANASVPAATSGTVDDAPRVLIRLPTATSGSTWWVTEAGHTDRRTPIVVPFADLDLGPASTDGSILATTAAQVLTVRIDGRELITTSSVPLPVGHALVPACFAGDGRAVLADAETLSLVALSEGVVEPFGAVAFTLGECAALADGRTVVATDGGGLVAVGPDGASTPIVRALGRHLSSGGRRLSMIDPSQEFGEAVVREGTVSEDGSLGAVIGTVAGDPDGRIVGAQSSPDGQWLAVVVERETAAEPEARLRVYRVGNDGLTLIDECALEVGARITILADP